MFDERGEFQSNMTVDEALSDVCFQQECLHLLTPYYRNPEIPLRHALDREATHIYLRRCDDGNLGAVFFARAPEFLMKDFPLVGYMGLTVAASDGNDQRRARGLWRDYLRHARTAAQESPAIAWYRTASPFGLYPCHYLLENGQPRPDGSFSEEGEAMVDKLRAYYGLASDRNDRHPFVVRRYASARYSDFERIRLAQFGNLEAVALLRQLAISEQDGDRLLMLGHIP